MAEPIEMKIAIVIIALPMVYNVCFVDNPSVFEPKTLSRINAIPMIYKTKMTNRMFIHLDSLS